jgi:hypothetical protein
MDEKCAATRWSHRIPRRRERAAMGEYTVINLKEVEDQAPKFGLSPNLESRFATVPLELERSLRQLPTSRP